MPAPFTFTSANTSFLVNDKSLNGVYDINVFEQDEDGVKITYISLHRHIIGSDELVNEMRSGAFTFKLLNNSSSAGYVAPHAKVDSFNMSLCKEDDGEERLLKQTISLRTTGFLYVEDARSAGMKATEQEDLDNLIKILKENQERAVKGTAFLPNDVDKDTLYCSAVKGAEDARKRGGFIKYGDGKEVDVTDDELVWLNANDPTQLKDTKPRKLKKDKKKHK